jgi:hypothetical protein
VSDGGDHTEPGLVADLLRLGLPHDVLVTAVMQCAGISEGHAREMIAIETGRSDGDVVLVDECPPDLVPFFVRSPDEHDRWQTCWALSLKMLGGEDLGGWRPMVARQLYASDIPTG